VCWWVGVFWWAFGVGGCGGLGFGGFVVGVFVGCVFGVFFGVLGFSDGEMPSIGQPDDLSATSVGDIHLGRRQPPLFRSSLAEGLFLAFSCAGRSDVTVFDRSALELRLLFVRVSRLPRPPPS